MGKSSSNDELTIRNQFDRICKLALKGEAADYYRHIAYRQKHEVLFSELSQKELDSIFGVDKYTVENKCFRVLGYDIEVKDTLLAEAIQSLSENKRKVVLLSYFMDMSDADIARMMNLVRSTVYEHRKRSGISDDVCRQRADVPQRQPEALRRRGRDFGAREEIL